MIDYVITISAITLFILFTSAIDSEHLLDNDFIEDHTTRVFQRFAFALALLPYSIWASIAYTFLFMASFDQVLNLMRGLPIWYLGSTAKWDKFFNKRMTLYKIIKVICLISGLYTLALV